MEQKRGRGTRARFAVLLLLICAAVSPGLAGTAEAAGGCTTTSGSTTCTFEYTGAVQTWTVPDGVTQVTLDVLGAQGGYEGAQGGQGGRAAATIAVTPGETLTILVGGQGHSPFTGGDTGGGFNGGGNGGAPYDLPATYSGSGGGGASDVRVGGTELADRIVVAGGGGGAADVFGPDGASSGGAGGGLIGGTGNTAYIPYAASGGAGGNQDGTTGSGLLGTGSNGVASGSNVFNGVGGGGGGGGYYGGAAGSPGTGGGGGSGFGPAGTVFATGVRSGNGQVVLTYSPADSFSPTTTIALSPTSPDGNNGWYVHQPTVTVGAADNGGGSGVAETRCVLDPSTVPSSFDALPSTPCPYLLGGAAVADGAHTLYAASVDNAGNPEGPVQSASLKVDTALPQDAPVVTGTLGTNGWYTSDVSVAWHWSDALSGINAANCPQSSGSGGGDGHWSAGSLCYDMAGNHTSDTRSINIDKTPPTLSPSLVDGMVFVIGAPAPTVSPNANDPISGIASASCGAVNTATLGTRSVSCTAQDNAGNTTNVSRSYTVGYAFSGFASPVDNGVLNVAKAGRAIPLKFRLTNASGAPITTLSSATITSVSLSCSGLSEGSDEIEEYTAGASALENLGNGYYQLNWRSPADYAGSCRQLRLNLGEGSTASPVFHTADFQFTK